VRINTKNKKERIFRAVALFTAGGFILSFVTVDFATAQASGGKKKFVITGGTVGAPIYAVGGFLGSLIDEKIHGANASVTTGQGFTALEQVFPKQVLITIARGLS
jgi:hypothetical protein